jgi:hypothetical protein
MAAKVTTGGRRSEGIVKRPTSNIEYRTESKFLSLAPKQRELREEYRSKLSTFVPTTGFRP